MSGNKGKYYWVRTENGIEIGFQRYSGQWELCGISAGDNVNDAILDVIREVANDVDTSDKQCNIDNVVGQSEQLVCECEEPNVDNEDKPLPTCKNCFRPMV